MLGSPSAVLRRPYVYHSGRRPPAELHLVGRLPPWPLPDARAGGMKSCAWWSVSCTLYAAGPGASEAGGAGLV